MNQPDFMIGNIPIYGDLILAPMDGITDQPFRSLCRQLGSAMSITEFINALDVLTHHPRYHHRYVFNDSERPLSLQMLGDHPEQILEAARQLVPRVKPDLIDINLGCQSKNVTSRGAGAALMLSPGKIGEIFRTMTDHFKMPITGKIRLGWDDNHLNYLEIARTIQDNGGAMVAVHGRTRHQGYRGKARWEPIGEIKQALDIPVIGNGDVETVSDIQRMKAETGCDAIMIGRAAIGNPWIFSGLDRNEVPLPVVEEVVCKQLSESVRIYGEKGVITFRKFLKAYLKPYALSHEVLLPLLKITDPEEIRQALEDLFANLDTR